MALVEMGVHVGEAWPCHALCEVRGRHIRRRGAGGQDRFDLAVGNNDIRIDQTFAAARPGKAIDGDGRQRGVRQDIAVGGGQG